MKKAMLLITLLCNFAMAAAPPVSIKGQDGSKLIPKWNFQTPYNQATNLGGIDALIETGNGNFLVNPGFEASNAVSGWTALGTPTPITGAGNPRQGSKTIEINPGAQASGVTFLAQNVTPTENLGQKNIEYSIDLQVIAAPGTSGDRGFKVCAMNGATEVYCDQVSDKYINQWGRFSIILPGPSSGSVGLKVVSTSAITFTATQYDDAYVGRPRNLASFASGGQYLGSVKITGCAAGFTASNATFATMGTQTGCVYTVDGSLLAPTTNIGGFRIPSLPPGTIEITYDGRSSISSSNGLLRFHDGTNASQENITVEGSSVVSSFSGHITYTAPQSNLTIQVQSQSSGLTMVLNGTTANPGNFRVTYYPAAQLQATRADQTDYDWTAYIPTFSGLGTPPSVACFHKRDASSLKVRCKLTAGTVTGSEARVSLPNGLLPDSTKIAATKDIVGFGSANFHSASNFGQFAVRVEPSNSYFTFSAQSSVGDGWDTSSSGSVLTGSGIVMGFSAEVPIQGWTENQRAPLLVNGVSSRYNGNMNIETAEISTAGVVTEGTSDWINGNCVVASNRYTCTFNAGVFGSKPFSCTAICTGGTCWQTQQQTLNSTTFAFETLNNSGGLVNGATNIECKGPR